MQDKLFCLTGATGLLGGNILRLLLDRGQKVRLLVRPNNPATKNLPGNPEIVEGDLLNRASLKEFLMAPAGTQLVVIHAAALVTMDPRPRDLVYQVNVEGTRMLVDKCVEHGVKKLVYISSTGVLPELPLGEPIAETKNLNPNIVRGYYSKTKAMATELVFEAVEKQDLDASVVYPSGIFGPNDYGSGLITSSLKMVAQGKLPLSIGGSFNSVDARDLAEAVISCAERGRKGEGYIVAAKCHSFKELVDIIARKMGLRRSLITVPLWLIKPFANLGLIYADISKKPVLLSSFVIYNLARNNNFSSEKAQRELGFSCRSLEETIEDTLAWLRKRGELEEKSD